MKKRLLSFILVFVFHVLIAQEICESPNSSQKDVNTISKCSAEKSKAPENASGFISQKVRYLKKRNVEKTPKERKYTNNLNPLEHKELAATFEASLKNNIKHIAYEISKKENEEAISFTSIEKIPLFSSCQNTYEENEKDCFNRKMSDHLTEHFKYPQENSTLGGKGTILVSFTVNENGYVTNILTTGSENGVFLKKEIKRVISKLPRLIPGKHQGKNVSVNYTFPMGFNLD
ncbi:energy transducer TonB [Tenacibaculum maritimum]|uniref:energy transducer TonB n=1 Tax=Tenacibaculum maritimum TaxID=107401 RepID=UPI0003FA6364|nr:energy transducer TonB [Tenacibaculum maritimum]